MKGNTKRLWTFDFSNTFVLYDDAQKNHATSQKSLDYLTTIASQLAEWFCLGRKKKSSNFHNFTQVLHNNPDKLLNQRCPLAPCIFYVILKVKFQFSSVHGISQICTLVWVRKLKFKSWKLSTHWHFEFCPALFHCFGVSIV